MNQIAVNITFEPFWSLFPSKGLLFPIETFLTSSPQNKIPFAQALLMSLKFFCL